MPTLNKTEFTSNFSNTKRTQWRNFRRYS